MGGRRRTVSSYVDRALSSSSPRSFFKSTQCIFFLTSPARPIHAMLLHSNSTIAFTN